MIRLNRWWYAFVLLVLLAAVFVDVFGDAYQAWASSQPDPRLGCNGISFRAQNLSQGSGSWTIYSIAPTGNGKAVETGGWKFDTARGSQAQQIAQYDSQTLATVAASQTGTRPAAGNALHFKLQLDKGGPSHTFWVSCASLPPAVTATPSPKASASPSASASAHPSASATVSAKPSASASASASASPTASSAGSGSSSLTGTLWVDNLNAPTIFGWSWPFSLHKGLDLVGGTELTIVICHGPNDPAGSTCHQGLGNVSSSRYSQAQQETIPIIQQRVNSLGVAEATVQAQNNDQIVVQIPGVGLSQAEQTVGTTAKLHFATAVQGAPTVTTTGPGGQPQTAINPQMVHDQQGLYDPAQFSDPLFYPVTSDASGNTVGWHWKMDNALPASDVSSASAGTDPTTGQPVVILNFNAQGAAEWNKITTAASKLCAATGTPGNQSCTNQVPQAQVAIFLDDKVISAPYVTSPSSNSTEITGLGSVKAVQTLASQLNAGSLPADISTIAATEVSPTLGASTVQDSLIAGAIGLIGVILFMLLYYRFPGLLASIALLCYAAIVLAVFKVIAVTVTLAGLAGFVLSVGMAVDANVLIFERTRDELRHGQPTLQAVAIGFRRAFPAIRDSNLSTAIACVVLYWLGSQEIRGFAITLLIGVAVSFFSAIVITQTLLNMALHFRWGRNPRLYTRLRDTVPTAPVVPDEASPTAPTKIGRFDIVTLRNRFFAVSLAVLIPGILAILVWGFNLGIDFAGGNSVTVQLAHSASQSQVVAAVNAVEQQVHPQVQQLTGNTFTINTLPSSIDHVQTIITTLQSKWGIANDSTGHPNVQVSTVGPTIAQGLVTSAVALVLVASLLIALYLALVFRGQKAISPWRFAVCTIFKLLHDVFVLLGIWAILGHFSDVGQISQLFITAALTSVAFSIHDTIVVFDRIRENLATGPRLTFEQTINLSTVQTMTRSLNTALTVVFVLLSLVLFGGASIQGFVLALLVGIVTGTYSSIFNASTMLVAWNELDRRLKERRGTTGRSAVGA